MSTVSTAPADRFPRLMPRSITRGVRVVAWLSLIGNILIIGSGGIVRLTKSGLGCTELVIACTKDSFFANDGVHSVIEQGNRGVGVVLGLVSILAVVMLIRLRRERTDLWAHAWILLSGVVIQGIVGPLSIVVKLDALFVGIHFVLSAILVGVAASFVVRIYALPGRRERAIPLWMMILTHVATLLLTAEVVMGVFTTGNGPHSGDKDVVRDTSKWEPLVHIHAWIGYALAAALVVLLIGAVVNLARRTRGARHYLTALSAVIVVVAVQILVGVTQARIGIPPLLVVIHMLLAAVTIALMVLLVTAVRRPVAGDVAEDAPASVTAASA